MAKCSECKHCRCEPLYIPSLWCEKGYWEETYISRVEISKLKEDITCVDFIEWTKIRKSEK